MEMMIKRVFIIFLLIIPIHIYSQNINDFGTWWGAEVRKTFLEDFKVAVRAEIRLNENSSFTKNFYIAPEFQYSPIKWLSLGINYRFDNRYQASDRYFTQRHRIGFDLELSHEIKRFKLEYRNRTQMHWENYFSNNTDYPVMFNRNLIGLTYKWPQLPFKTNISGEIWLPLEQNTELSQFRMVVEQEYELKKQHKFQLRFIFQTDLGNSNIWRNYIISARYIFSF
jgi:hypothetical protein